MALPILTDTQLQSQQKWEVKEFRLKGVGDGYSSETECLLSIWSTDMVQHDSVLSSLGAPPAPLPVSGLGTPCNHTLQLLMREALGAATRDFPVLSPIPSVCAQIASKH